MTISTQRDDLHQAIDRLPDNSLTELAKFIEFLQFKIERFESLPEVWEQPEVEDQSLDKSLPPRVLGLHQGQGWISEDFNDPLPDAFWLGE